ncbi:hypothetical protein L0Y65_05660 [Candidatus Micrarchaeota archaeon]|nr:hypothetical protein [Candidatus Micrarchaeota archaeon]
MQRRTGRTALALAFGDHPGHCCGVSYGADKGFFRASIIPFLDEQAIDKGNKVTVIHEFNVGFNLAGADRKNPEDAKRVRQMVEQTESFANAELERTLDAGEMPGMYRDWLDWGYLERIAEINRMRPGMIRNRIEPLRQSTVWRMWDQSVSGSALRKAAPFCERVEAEMELIRLSIGICLERSGRVIALAGEIREREPGTAIAIPRGWAHRGMAGHFEYSDYEVRVAYGLKGVPHFSSEAIAESFTRTLSDDELRRYAALSLHYGEYMGRNGCRIHGGAENPESIPVERIWEISAQARRYALERVGPAVRRLPAALP